MDIFLKLSIVFKWKTYFFASWTSNEIVSRSLSNAGGILWPGRSLFDQDLCTHWDECFVNRRLKYLIISPLYFFFNTRLWRILTHFWIIKQNWAFLSNTNRIFHSDAILRKITSKKPKVSDSLNWNMYSRIIPNETPVKISIPFSNEIVK